jgi:hypothetical protein
MKTKILISSGCSFTDTEWDKTWPVHLAEYFPNAERKEVGLGSSGNGLISRKVIYEVTEALKKYKPEEILVGVMWSSRDRSEFYTHDELKFDNSDGWRQNPTNFILGTNKSWNLLHWGWKNEYSKLYYSTFHDNIGSLIYTYEHVLRTQWFLKLNKIPYFMSNITEELFNNGISGAPDVIHLHDQIDKLHFLPVLGEHEWARDHSGLEFRDWDGWHPSPEQHKLFVEKIIVPFLQEKNYI